MTLEFDLNLIMPEDNTAIFSRGALEMTIKLIKSSEPAMAIEVGEILAQEPLPTGNEFSQDPNQHMFHVRIPPGKIRIIVDVILNVMENNPGELPLGMSVVAKALFKDWTDLARLSLR
ncbi:MAG: hypothetical protein HRT35_25200 [Algicola sp.]|nr:hypothetical protein [Algicola sp.]